MLSWYRSRISLFLPWDSPFLSFMCAFIDSLKYVPKRQNDNKPSNCCWRKLITERWFAEAHDPPSPRTTTTSFCLAWTFFFVCGFVSDKWNRVRSACFTALEGSNEGMLERLYLWGLLILKQWTLKCHIREEVMMTTHHYLSCRLHNFTCSKPVHSLWFETTNMKHLYTCKTWLFSESYVFSVRRRWRTRPCTWAHMKRGRAARCTKRPTMDATCPNSTCVMKVRQLFVLYTICYFKKSSVLCLCLTDRFHTAIQEGSV